MNRASAIRPWILGIALPLIALCTYIPVIRTGGYIWDDDAHVYKNPALLGLQGLHDIWFKISATQQYYPMVFSSFWFEHRLFDFWPAPYHFDNALLHALTALLLWRLLERLEVPGAWLAAAIFAVHPMNVESVAWVTERKNVLCGFFVLLYARSYIRFALPEQYHPDDALSEFESSIVYLFSFAVFIAALLSKTTACTAPGAILLLIWWKRGKLSKEDWRRIIPFFVVGALMGWLTAYLEKGQIGAKGPYFNFTPVDRVLIAGRALWFYAVKFVYPKTLIFFYPRWHISAHQGWQFLFPISAVGLLAATWALRRRMGRGAVAALLYFGGMLLPALGFVNVYPMRFSYVADHFAYLAAIGLAVLVAAGITRVFRHLDSIPFAALCAILLFLLIRITVPLQAMYQNEQVLWKATIALNDRAEPAYTNLGGLYNAVKRYDLAQPLFARAVELEPDDPLTLYNLGRVYVETGHPELAKPLFEHAIQIAPRYGDAYEQLAEIQHFEGDDQAAMKNLRLAILYHPRNPQSYAHLSQILDARGQGDDAIRVLETSAMVTPYAPTHYNLAILLMRHGQRNRAEQELREALRLQPDFEAAQQALRQLQDLPPSP